MLQNKAKLKPLIVKSWQDLREGGITSPLLHPTPPPMVVIRWS